MFSNSVFTNNKCKKSENGKYGFVDRNGQWIVPPKYDLASWHENDHYGTFSENTYLKEGAVNKYGKIIFPCIYEGIYMSFDKELNRYEVRLEKSKEVESMACTMRRAERLLYLPYMITLGKMAIFTNANYMEKRLF